MRSLHFWILLVGSIIVCALYFEQIYLSRELYQQQRFLVDSQQIASMGAAYESSWKQLATRLYQESRQDEAMAEVLKRNQIAIQVNKPGSASAPVPAPTTAPAPSGTVPVSTPVPVSSKTKTPTGL